VQKTSETAAQLDYYSFTSKPVGLLQASIEQLQEQISNLQKSLQHYQENEEFQSKIQQDIDDAKNGLADIKKQAIKERKLWRKLADEKKEQISYNHALTMHGLGKVSTKLEGLQTSLRNFQANQEVKNKIQAEIDNAKKMLADANTLANSEHALRPKKKAANKVAYIPCNNTLTTTINELVKKLAEIEKLLVLSNAITHANENEEWQKLAYDQDKNILYDNAFIINTLNNKLARLEKLFALKKVIISLQWAQKKYAKMADDTWVAVFTNVLINYQELYEALLKDTIKDMTLPQTTFVLIADHFINEANETVNNPNRDPVIVANNAKIFINNLYQYPPPSFMKLLIYGLTGVLLGAAIGAVIGGSLGAIFGAALPSAICGALIGLVVGVILAYQFYMNDVNDVLSKIKQRKQSESCVYEQAEELAVNLFEFSNPYAFFPSIKSIGSAGVNTKDIKTILTDSTIVANA
jgi:hypothetical protein